MELIEALESSQRAHTIPRRLAIGALSFRYVILYIESLGFVVQS